MKRVLLVVLAWWLCLAGCGRTSEVNLTPQGLGYQDWKIVPHREGGQAWFEVRSAADEVLVTSPQYSLRHTTWFVWDGKGNVWAYSGDVGTTVWVSAEGWRSYPADKSGLAAPSYLVQQRSEQHAGELVKSDAQLTVDALKIGANAALGQVRLFCRNGEEQTYSVQAGDLLSFCGQLIAIEELGDDWIHLNVYPNVCSLPDGPFVADDVRVWAATGWMDDLLLLRLDMPQEAALKLLAESNLSVERGQVPNFVPVADMPWWPGGEVAGDYGDAHQSTGELERMALLLPLSDGQVRLALQCFDK